MEEHPGLGEYQGVRFFVSSLFDTDDEQKSKLLNQFNAIYGGPSSLVNSVKIDEKEGIELIRALFSWLPFVIESARFVFEILENLDHFISPIYGYATNFLFDLTKDKLDDLEIELDEMGEGKRAYLSRTLLDDLLLLVKNPNFQCMIIVNGFEFNVPSLLEFDVVESDRENNIVYLHLLEVIERLPKEEVTKDLFEDFLDDEIESMASLCPLFLEEEFRWVLDRGCKYRTKLADCFVPRVNHDTTLNIEIDRRDILGSSMEQIVSASIDDLRKGVWVIYVDEEGRGHGVIRDWLIKVLEKMVESDGRQPFEKSGEDKEADHKRIFPRRGSGLDPTYYICCGRLFGLALIHRVQIGHTFDNVMYVQFRGQNVKLEDIKDAVPSKYQAYKEMLSMDEKTISRQNVYFPDSFEGDTGSADDQVTSENVEKYVSHVIDMSFVGIETSSLIEGLDDILTRQGREYFFQIVTLQDLDSILRGIQDVNFEDWKESTTYELYEETDLQILWFWKWLGNLSAEDQINFLIFWTSTSWLPSGGFKDMDPPLVIRKTTDTSRFPSVQACVCALDIPVYDSEEILCSKLQMALDNHIRTSGSFFRL
ncbi:hypothetical protein POM88_052006 [Heracleum sosnowskyi]|uniref:HECT-type E3 ubiquitin transferase n=1 Tax=Heracleum sosnowskyi TaxID=360622 RepID=A0AAD8LY91_9APIA|nr:hypothetical protein POM88_052006 [Heracleum sosnowskyi]